MPLRTFATIPCPPAPKKNGQLLFDSEKNEWVYY
jgi:hypothetical protein